MNQYPRCSRIQCPFCRNESAMTYEENGLYKSNCLFEECKEVLMIKSTDEISAITKFNRIRVQSV